MSFHENFGACLSSNTPTPAGTRIYNAASNGSRNLTVPNTSRMPVYGTRPTEEESRPGLQMLKSNPQLDEQYQGELKNSIKVLFKTVIFRWAKILLEIIDWYNLFCHKTSYKGCFMERSIHSTTFGLQLFHIYSTFRFCVCCKLTLDVDIWKHRFSASLWATQVFFNLIWICRMW